MDRKNALSPRHSSRAPDCPTRFLEETVWMSGGWMVGETGGGGSDDVEEEEAGITLG